MYKNNSFFIAKFKGSTFEQSLVLNCKVAATTLIPTFGHNKN